MGSDETVITIPGALEKLTFLTGTGRHRVQIAHFFRMQIGSRARSGIGLGSDSRLRRMRRFLELPKETKKKAHLGALKLGFFQRLRRSGITQQNGF